MAYKHLLLAMPLIFCYSIAEAKSSTFYIFDRAIPLEDNTKIIPLFDSSGISAIKGGDYNGIGRFLIDKETDACEDMVDFITIEEHVLDSGTVLYEKKFTYEAMSSFEKPITTGYLLTDCEITILFYEDLNLMEKWLSHIKSPKKQVHKTYMDAPAKSRQQSPLQSVYKTPMINCQFFGLLLSFNDQVEQEVVMPRSRGSEICFSLNQYHPTRIIVVEGLAYKQWEGELKLHRFTFDKLS